MNNNSGPARIYDPKANPYTPDFDRRLRSIQSDLYQHERRYGRGSINATRRGGPGNEWLVTGPSYEAIKEWKDIIFEFGSLIGFKGKRESIINQYLDHMNGDLLEKRAPKRVNPMDTERTVLNSAGQKEAFRGRRRWAGDVVLVKDEGVRAGKPEPEPESKPVKAKEAK